jgi:hypothetical protein
MGPDVSTTAQKGKLAALFDLWCSVPRCDRAGILRQGVVAGAINDGDDGVTRQSI